MRKGSIWWPHPFAGTMLRGGFGRSAECGSAAMRRVRQLHKRRPPLTGTMWPSTRLRRWGVLVVTLVLALRLVLSGVAQPSEVALTPLAPGATPTAVAVPAASPVGMVERFQGLPVGEQIAIVAIIVTIFISLVGGVRWWIERGEQLARERQALEAGLRSSQAFTLRRAQIVPCPKRLLDSALVLRTGWSTGRDSIARGALEQVSSE
jgi:hypothetical protein